MNYAIILAGGSGTRFWPLSRQLKPKQFLSICSHSSLLGQTIQRIAQAVSKENIFIATNQLHNRRISKHLKKFKIPLSNFFFEPKGKNTLAPTAVISQIISLSDNDAVVAVLPCDHLVAQNKKFARLLRRGLWLARDGYIVTLGVRPTDPHTGYGYIRVGLRKPQEKKFYKVEGFIEKPALKQARVLFKDRRYFWNSGIFIFRPRVLLEELRRYLPQMYEIIAGIQSKAAALRRWDFLPALSIDYGVMEKTNRAVFLPVDYTWTDIGSWSALIKLLPKDKEGNIFKGPCLDVDSRNIFVWSDRRLVATVGMKDVIVVDTADALLVCARDKAQEVKRLVQILKQDKWKKHL